MWAPASPGTKRSPVNAGRTGTSARRSGSRASVPTRRLTTAARSCQRRSPARWTRRRPVFLYGFPLRMSDDRAVQHANTPVGQRRRVRLLGHRAREARVAQYLLETARAEAPIDAALAGLGLG